ncbi:MAG: hypothetical protein M1839_003124 [Geoglossum umbratile]|nr:MAG: hypothetical protein M1839_003124 [Geoglossum umbratile]
MDPFSAATGIAGLVCLTMEVSKILGEQVKVLKNAPGEARDLLHELDLIEQVLHNLEGFLLSEKARGNSFKETSVLVKAMGGFKAEIEELSYKLLKLAEGGGLSQMVERGKWFFRREESLELTKTLHRYLGMFQISLNINGMYVVMFTYDVLSESPTANISSTLLSESVDDVAQDMKHIIKTISTLIPDPLEAQKTSQQFNDVLQFLTSLSNVSSELPEILQIIRRREAKWQDQESQDIIAWLSPLNFKIKQNDTLGRRREGTGNWLLKAVAFDDWMNGDSKILYCPGIPGAGKTVLTSVIVDHLVQSFQRPDVGIAYIYCNYKEEISQTTGNLISSLLQQLVESRPAIPEEVKSLYKHYKGGSTRPTIDECSRLLCLEVDKFSTVYIVIDALDECRGDRWRDVLDRVRELPPNVKLLVTSRHIPTIERYFEKQKRLEIQASDEDIKEYLHFRIARNYRLACHVKKDSTLPEKITTVIVKKADGMFLLAQLHMDSLVEKLSLGEVHNALDGLPKELDKAYDDALKRIEGQREYEVRVAKIVLRWLSFAVRPLTVQEIQCALAVEQRYLQAVEQQDINIVHNWKPDVDFLSNEDILLSLCAGLVIIDRESNIIRLVHYTTQAYFERCRDQRFPDGQKIIAMTCVIYISMNTFAEGYCPTDEILETRLQQNALFSYAAQNWGIHACGTAEQTVHDLALKFLLDNSKVLSSSQVLLIPEHRYSKYSQSPPKRFSGISLAACFGLTDTMVRLLLGNGTDPDFKDDYGRTPVSWAAARGHKAVVELLANRQDVVADSRDESGRTPLSWAAAGGHNAVVELLANRHDVAADSKDESDRTPLSWAAAGGHTAVAKLLANRHDVVADSKDESNQTPLSWAATRGHVAVVKLLADRLDVATDSKGGSGWTPLSQAAAKGHAAVVKLLADREDVVADSKDNSGWTPLSQAAAKGHTVVVELLADREDVVADTKDKFGLTPLSLAAAGGHIYVVELLANRPDVVADSKDESGRTPLSWAAAGGRRDVVELLADRGDVVADSKDKSGRTPLSWAAAGGRASVVELLVGRHDVVVDTEDVLGLTPLSLAVAGGHTTVVELLKPHNPPPPLPNTTG